MTDKKDPENWEEFFDLLLYNINDSEELKISVIGGHDLCFIYKPEENNGLALETLLPEGKILKGFISNDDVMRLHSLLGLYINKLS